MGEYYFLIGIALTLLVALLSPGPSFLYVARTAVAMSRPHGIAVALGLATGSVALAILAMFGLYVILEAVPWLYLSLKIAGGLYLFYIAYKIWKSANRSLAENSDELVSQSSLLKSYASGLLIQLSNPKTSIVLGSVFAAFLPSKVPDYTYLLLAIISFSLAAGWYGIVAILLSAEKPRRIYGSFKTTIDRAASGIMGALGIKLVSNQ